MKGPLKKISVLIVIAVFAVPMAVALSAPAADGDNEFVSYYAQLDANEKAIYDAMVSADADTMNIVVDLPVELTARSDSPAKAMVMLDDIVRSDVDNAFDALMLSEPLAYWGWVVSSVKWETNLSISGNVASVSSVSFEISYIRYPVDPATGEFQGIEKMLADLNAAVNSFHTDAATVRDKVLDINNYLVNLVTYDPGAGDSVMESRYAHDAYGALVDPNHYAVCDGYSKAFQLLCMKEGIECIVVLGTGMPISDIPVVVNHAWNYVKMDDGQWYAMDVTWNDDENDMFLTLGGTGNLYFLKGNAFFNTHQPGIFLGSGLVTYPFNSPPLSILGYDEYEAINMEKYSWILAVIMVALIAFALYRHSKRKG